MKAYEDKDFNDVLWDVLLAHRGHNVQIVIYGDSEDPADVCLECEDCGEMILDAEIYTLCAREDEGHKQGRASTTAQAPATEKSSYDVEIYNDHYAVVRVGGELLDRIYQYLSLQPGLDEDAYQGEDNTLSVTAHFPDGKEMDVKCCGCQDEASWTEAVLFGKNGCELCCSEPDDEFIGNWMLSSGDKTYAVRIMRREEN